jgi:sirohydrochlorin ferrochelatase
MKSTRLGAGERTTASFDCELGGRSGFIIVDHGSQRADSNHMLLDVVSAFRDWSGHAIVEPAHMELAEPSIALAYSRCVAQGAEVIVVHPYFLLPGRHWDRDIPQLVRRAAARYPGTRYLVTAPLGMHPYMLRVIHDRITQCLAHALGRGEACALCRDTERCQIKEADG